MKRLILFSALALSSLAAHAQLGVYAGYSATKLDVANSDWVFGPSFGLFYEHHLAVINFGLDGRAYFITSSSTMKITSGLAGPRVSVHIPAVPIHPYAEFLAGVAQAHYSQPSESTDSTDFAYGFSGGLDLHILPYLDLRAIDFTYLRLQDIFNPTDEKTLTFGIVLHVPHT